MVRLSLIKNHWFNSEVTWIQTYLLSYEETQKNGTKGTSLNRQIMDR